MSTPRLTSGTRTTLQFVPEDIYGGVDVMATPLLVPIVSETLGQNINTITSEMLRSDRRMPSVRGGNISGAGDIVSELMPRAWFNFWQHLLSPAEVVVEDYTTLLIGITDEEIVPVGQFRTSDNEAVFVCTQTGNSVGLDAETALASFVMNIGDRGTVGDHEFMYFAMLDDQDKKDKFNEHRLAGGTSLPAGGITVEKLFRPGGTGQIPFRLLGGRVNTCAINIQQEGMVGVTWGMLFQKADAIADLRGSPLTPWSSGNPIFAFDTRQQVVAIADLLSVSGTVFNMWTEEGVSLLPLGTKYLIQGEDGLLRLGTLVGESGGGAVYDYQFDSVDWEDPANINSVWGTAPVDLQNEPFAGYDTYLEIGLTSDPSAKAIVPYLQSGTINIANNFDETPYALGTRYRRGVPEGRREASGTLTLFFEDMVQFGRFAAESELVLKFTFINKDGVMKLTLPRCKFTGGSPTPQVQGQGVVTSTFDFQAYYQGEVTGDDDIFADSDILLSIVASEPLEVVTTEWVMSTFSLDFMSSVDSLAVHASKYGRSSVVQVTETGGVSGMYIGCAFASLPWQVGNRYSIEIEAYANLTTWDGSVTLEFEGLDYGNPLNQLGNSLSQQGVWETLSYSVVVGVHTDGSLKFIASDTLAGESMAINYIKIKNLGPA